MPTFSFDVVSDFDKSEMNNVFSQTEREIATRYDFKNTPAGIEWLGDKKGFVITGAGEWQLDAVLDIIRKKCATRGVSTKVLDLTKSPVDSNLKSTWEIPFKQGLDQENAKLISKLLRESVPKVKPVIQGDAVRVSAGSKDDLQKAISSLEAADMPVPLQYINYR